MKSLEETGDIFEGLNTVVLGMSVDTVPSKKAWADYRGTKKTNLVSDFWPHGEVANSIVYSEMRMDFLNAHPSFEWCNPFAL